MQAWATRWLENLGRLRGQDPTSTDARRDVEREASRVEDRWRRFLDVGEHSAGWPMSARFDDRGTLLSTATQEQLEKGFLYACGYGHPEVIRVFLDRGVDSNLRQNGETGLHWASFGPHPGIAQLLLQHGAAVDVRDDRFKSTPLDWTLHAWSKARGQERERGYEMVALLVGAGATVQHGAAERVGDRRMEEMLKTGPRA